jgi:hypothetical protein
MRIYFFIFETSLVAQWSIASVLESCETIQRLKTSKIEAKA